MDNKPKEDKLMVITLDNSNPKSKIYWKEEDYNIFEKMCDDLITKYFGDTINYPLDMLTLEIEEKVEPNQKTLEIS